MWQEMIVVSPFPQKGNSEKETHALLVPEWNVPDPGFSFSFVNQSRILQVTR